MAKACGRKKAAAKKRRPAVQRDKYVRVDDFIKYQKEVLKTVSDIEALVDGHQITNKTDKEFFRFKFDGVNKRLAEHDGAIKRCSDTVIKIDEKHATEAQLRRQNETAIRSVWDNIREVEDRINNSSVRIIDRATAIGFIEDQPLEFVKTRNLAISMIQSLPGDQVITQTMVAMALIVARAITMYGRSLANHMSEFAG